MRILVHEFVTGGGLAGRPVPASLAREGSAMLAALVEDLAASRDHEIVATTDPRFPLAVPASVEVVALTSSTTQLDDLIESSDAVWIVAPETDRCLERLAGRVERTGKVLLGSGAAAIRRASDKADLARRLVRHCVPHPVTRVIPPGRPDQDAAGGVESECVQAAREIGYPVVLKPARGAGCDRVCLACDSRELGRALRIVGRGPLLLQRYVSGVAASVSLLADGNRATVLAVNAQHVYVTTRTVPRDDEAWMWRPFSYRGGRTPLDHVLADRAAETALRVCGILPGLRGWVGVDFVLAESEAIVIEVNPRLTTSYLGVRAALKGNREDNGNLAAMMCAACTGALPTTPPLSRSVRFTPGGRILHARD
jgi:predicted ATP-grasp superfamily ATP-dependent carboligase